MQRPVPVIPFLLLLALLAMPAAAQTIRFGTTTAHPGEIVTVEVWYEAGGGSVGFDFIGRFEPALEIVAFRQGDYPFTACNVIPSSNELRIFGVEPNIAPLPDHRACSVDLRVDASASPGWHGLVFGPGEPTFHFTDMDAQPLPGKLDGGGVYVLKPARGTCTLVRQDVPDPDFVPEHAPVCACLRSGDFPLHRCGIRVPGMFELWREFPSTPDLSKWQTAEWTLIPLREGLPEVVVDSWSQHEGLSTKPVFFHKNPKPLHAQTRSMRFKVEGTKPLEALQVGIEVGGQSWQFEQHWSGRPEE